MTHTYAQWSDLFPAESEPTEGQIEAFVDSALWRALDQTLRQTYSVRPKLFYSGCMMGQGAWKGWNVKYKKSGKALCTLYPKRGYFVALLPIGIREMDEAELLMPTCTGYTQKLFEQTAAGHTGKSLAFEVKNEDILEDMKRLIALRAASR